MSAHADADLAKAARRTMRALDGYWGKWEIHGGWMDVWWYAFERWRARLDELLEAEARREPSAVEPPEEVGA